jgi:hypothetical protein
VPTFETVGRFMRDYAALTRVQQDAFREARKQFVEDLQSGQGFRVGLRVKGVQGAPGVYEMTWANDGRATWQYGPARRAGEAHVIWRRIGTHEIFKRP